MSDERESWVRGGGWPEMVKMAIFDPDTTEALGRIFEIVSDLGIGSAPACAHVMSVVAESAYLRGVFEAKADEIIQGISEVLCNFIESGTFDDKQTRSQISEEVMDLTLTKLQVLGGLCLVMGIMTGLNAAGAILLAKVDHGSNGNPSERVN
jgi:hypothetical protein